MDHDPAKAGQGESLLAPGDAETTSDSSHDDELPGSGGLREGLGLRDRMPRTRKQDGPGTPPDERNA